MTIKRCRPPRFTISLSVVFCVLVLFCLFQATKQGRILQRRQARRNGTFSCSPIVLTGNVSARKCSIGFLQTTQNSTKDASFTLVMNTYGPYAKRSRDSLEELIWHYCAIPEITAIVISWNPPYRDFEILVKRVREKCSQPVSAVLHERNSLNNKFRLTSLELHNNLVLHLDNDIFITRQVVRSSFHLFQSKYAMKLMGFFCAALLTDSFGKLGYRSFPPGLEQPEKCDFVLTGMVFMDHTIFHSLYFEPRFQNLRQIVSKFRSGEDLLMNAVAATTTYPHAVNYVPKGCLSVSDIKFSEKYGHNERFGKPLWEQRMMEFEGMQISKRSLMAKKILSSFGSLMGPILGVCENFSQMHILIPFHAGDPLVLDTAIKSVMDQKFPRKKIWLAPDGITPENEAYVETLCQRFSCAGTDQALRHGPAYTKFVGLKAIENGSQPGDVVVILDGDDKFIGSDAIDIIWSNYQSRDCWFTYGSMRGMYEEEIVQYERSGTDLRPRAMKWVWGHPRSMKVELLKYLERKDFYDDEGSWAMKASERGLVYKMVELSGFDHTCFIQNKIYK